MTPVTIRNISSGYFFTEKDSDVMVERVVPRKIRSKVPGMRPTPPKRKMVKVIGVRLRATFKVVKGSTWQRRSRRTILRL